MQDGMYAWDGDARHGACNAPCVIVTKLDVVGFEVGPTPSIHHGAQGGASWQLITAKRGMRVC